MTVVETVRQGTAGGTRILPFPLTQIAPEKPRCLWCDGEYTPVKTNQRYCKPKHRQYACERRKATLGTAVAALLQRHGASPQRAQNAASDVIETYYANGRIQRAVAALGWTYDTKAREWKVA